MVISRSTKRPHLVLPKQKSAGMQCEDCPQYKSAKLCSHVVAAACDNDQLDQFIALYSKMKRNPNITKLATSNTPKGRGRKGGKAPASRKPSQPIETRMELGTSAQCKDSHPMASQTTSSSHALNDPSATPMQSYLSGLPETFVPFAPHHFASTATPHHSPLQVYPYGMQPTSLSSPFAST